MEATYHLDESEFDYQFFKSLKATFKGKKLAITVKPQNEPSKSLEKLIEDAENADVWYTFEGDEFEKFTDKILKGEEIDHEQYKRTKS
jgi:hypothetical protein